MQKVPTGKKRKQILRNKTNGGEGRRGGGKSICSYLRICSVILVFCSMFQDACELNVVEVPLFVNGCLPVQLIYLLIRKPVSHCGEQLSQVVFLDEP